MELVYITPDFILSLSTLYKHKKAIKSKSYNMIITEPNLLITKAFIAQVANNSGIRCTLKPNSKLSKILGSKGIVALEAKYNPSDLRSGLEWDLDTINTQKRGIMVPKQIQYYEHQGGRVTYKMVHYKNRPSTSQMQKDDERNN